MSDLGPLSDALAAGLALGVFFFAGLYWTVRRGLASSNPALWFGLSALVRMAVIIAAFYSIARSAMPNVLACLLGLLIARVAVTRLTRPVR